ncbi:hypothetical protein IGB42_04134 [Andreprevotia sp. IGB-42]|uniref:phage terminase large subunit n=1 Tax=Andreprevotia sp. IGB-42 TaxID=2497473 RepID=UPI0013568E1C|nr:phage terminase large subunit [Andreprevotia sp. IGB-42]KAF0811368.1 hypothetical protein IGB42_04134 [Andreprevotia sp. IGB-42]
MPIRIETLARQNLLAYAKYQWPGYAIARHHRLMAERLQAVADGRCKRLMIFMPPRHGKSMLASEFFPAWYLGRHPDRYIIHATYAQELADDFGRKVRNQLAEPTFGAVFGNVGVRRDSTSARRFHTGQGGVYYAVGVGGPMTGRGAHLMLIDDPLKGREDADSDTVRRKLKDWYAAVAYTRLMSDGAIVVIQTRWHEDDLAGWLQGEHAHEGWEVLCLPAINTAGKPLWPQKFPLPVLQQIERTLGSREWEALYQQRPAPLEGGLIKLRWFGRYDVTPTHFDMVVCSWDTAQKVAQHNDPSVGTVWGVADGRYWLLDVIRKRVDYPALRQEVKQAATRHHASAVLIEDKASGVSLAQELKREHVPVIAIAPHGDKQSRMLRASPLIEAGKVMLPRRALWLGEFERECAGFPNSKHDDQVDSMSQFLNWAFERGPRPHASRQLARTSTVGDRYAGY